MDRELKGRGNKKKKGEKIEESKKREIMKEISQALLYLHGREIIHRDLKSNSILALHILHSLLECCYISN